MCGPWQEMAGRAQTTASARSAVATFDEVLAELESEPLRMIDADELMPDDILVHAEEQHRIAYVDRHDGWAWPIAGDGAGWAIALAHDPITVRRRAADSTVRLLHGR